MDIKELMIQQDVSIKTAIRRLDETAKKILIVLENEKFKGVITDGDIRRWILKNGDLEEEVIHITGDNPHFLKVADQSSAKKVFRKYKIDALPVINEHHEVVEILFKDDIIGKERSIKHKINNQVVIMAGGKGTRLHPYTAIIPKPLIPIGDVSILERIINRFEEVGCKQFFLTVNYKKNMIKAYMDEVDKHYEVAYIEEEKFLGTAGSLALLDDKITDTFFVSNCDILVEADYADVLKAHKKQKNKITMITSLKHFTIPYGIIETGDEGKVMNIKEKPEYNFQVNTGFYILEPEVIKDIEKDKYLDITELMQGYIDKGENVGVYPITENAWLDMGEFAEMERMSEKLGINIDS